LIYIYISLLDIIFSILLFFFWERDFIFVTCVCVYIPFTERKKLLFAGWLVNHPLNKMYEFQQHLLSCGLKKKKAT